MNRSDSGSRCFVTSSRDHPILLWDANFDDDGLAACKTTVGTTTTCRVTDSASKKLIRASYRGYDHVDELDSCISLCFNLTGDKIYGGSNRMIR
jgi:WD40 repeat protein